VTDVRCIIITVPPADVADAIDRIRREVSRIGDTYEALTYPPHVTLRTGAVVPARDVDRFLARMDTAVAGIEPFTIETDRFEIDEYTARGRPRYFVGYAIKPHRSLIHLHEQLWTVPEWRKRERSEFRPHLTIAFDDLDENGARRVERAIARSELAVPANLSWRCTNVSFYTRDDDVWKPYHVIDF
jgi:2'-5' RNA ligase